MTILAPVTDKADWCGEDIASGDGWTYRLTAEETADLRAMAQTIRPRLAADPNALLKLQKADFDLGGFAPRLATIYAGLKSGHGLALIKGLPIEEMELIDVATIYWGIGRHLGVATPNNPEGDMLGHITDLGKTQSDPNSRGYQTREAMDYHCDQCDIVGLICIRAARQGGVSKVSSSVAMYNAMLNRHPDYAGALTDALYWTKHGEYGAGELPYYTSPVFNFFDGQLCTSFGPKHIEKGHALPETPAMTELQANALRVAEEIAHEQRCEMVLEPGDMQFVNNYVTLHTRSDYVDFDDPARKRLLWRLWLMNDDLRPRTAYAEQWSKGVNVGEANDNSRIGL
ncbi:MAG: TauD/TfdA family dioxygenase [Rhizobiaceae bacterium]